MVVSRGATESYVGANVGCLRKGIFYKTNVSRKTSFLTFSHNLMTPGAGSVCKNADRKIEEKHLTALQLQTSPDYLQGPVHKYQDQQWKGLGPC